MVNKILVAVDKSEMSKQVFGEAVALAKAINASIMLLHVLSPLDEGYPTPVYPGVDNLYSSMHEEAIRAYTNEWKTFEQEGWELLRSLNSEALAAGVVTEYTQMIGDSGHTICDLARSWNADLIIMGRRGRSGLSELFLGSVSNYVLHHAPCSVLAVQGKVSAATTPPEPAIAAAQ
jgi:nucleotide-binding universal stress UspA family protein